MGWHSWFKLGALAALSCVFHQAKLRPLPKVFFPDNATVSECMNVLNRGLVHASADESQGIRGLLIEDCWKPYVMV
ncbi:hypothetical protein DER46DRAFT_592832 [Fusarium sp. MPI-SDFR-AT-0072]|nr:hypothetical protein DER46DRAFT_592832 [Fusarium sp. MPI-SDFR-AT-0072]